MLSKKVGVVFLLLGLVVAIPSQAEVTPLTTLAQCMKGCGYDEDCLGVCDDLLGRCMTCCHTKNPSATKEHCGAVCLDNLKGYTCKK